MKFSQGNVATHLRCGEIFNNGLLQIYCWIQWWKNIENLSTFDEVIANG